MATVDLLSGRLLLFSLFWVWRQRKQRKVAAAANKGFKKVRGRFYSISLCGGWGHVEYRSIAHLFGVGLSTICVVVMKSVQR